MKIVSLNAAGGNDRCDRLRRGIVALVIGLHEHLKAFGRSLEDHRFCRHSAGILDKDVETANPFDCVGCEALAEIVVGEIAVQERVQPHYAIFGEGFSLDRVGLAQPSTMK